MSPSSTGRTTTPISSTACSMVPGCAVGGGGHSPEPPSPSRGPPPAHPVPGAPRPPHPEHEVLLDAGAARGVVDAERPQRLAQRRARARPPPNRAAAARADFLAGRQHRRGARARRVHRVPQLQHGQAGRRPRPRPQTWPEEAAITFVSRPAPPQRRPRPGPAPRVAAIGSASRTPASGPAPARAHRPWQLALRQPSSTIGPAGRQFTIAPAPLRAGSSRRAHAHFL